MALILALTSHCFGQIGVTLPNTVNLCLRVATPLFILLFGCMVSLAHMPKYRKLDRLGATSGYWTRAIECYLWYLANQVALCLAGTQSVAYAIRCALFLGGTPYVQILSLYAIYFLLMPLIVMATEKYGLATLIVSALSVHLAFFEVTSLQLNPHTYGFDYEQRIIDLVLGFGYHNIIAGPSILHAFLLVTVGAWYGRLLRVFFSRGATIWSLTPPIAMLTIVSLWAVTQNEFIPVNLRTLSDMSLRNLNHPAYLSIYGAVGLTVITVIVGLTKAVRIPPAWTVLGRRSLFTFGMGNVVISLVKVHPVDMPHAIGTTVMIGSLIAILVYAYDAIVVANRVGSGDRNIWVKLVRRSRDVFTTAAGRIAETMALKVVG